jgi:hypothetical protein
VSAAATLAADQVATASAGLSKLATQIGEGLRALHTDTVEAERAFSDAAERLTTSVDAQAAVARDLAGHAEAGAKAQSGLRTTMTELQATMHDGLATLSATLAESTSPTPAADADSSLANAIESLAQAQANTVAELRELARAIQSTKIAVDSNGGNGASGHVANDESAVSETLRDILGEVQLTTSEVTRVGSMLEAMAARQFRTASRRSWVSRFLRRR